MSARETVLAALESHEPSGPHERANLEQITAFVEDEPSPMDRTNEYGHVVASGLVASPMLDRVVLLHHRQLGKWLQPGGHAEDGETRPARVATREAREETGLGLRPHPAHEGLLDVDAHRIPASSSMPEHWHFDLRYLLVGNPDVDPSAPRDEAREVRWFDVDEALGKLQLDDGLRRLVGKVEAIQSTLGGPGTPLKR